jgi:deoxyribose-phosphate aldolase
MSSLPSWLAPFADGSGVAAIIDHTLLKPETTPADIERLTAEARSFRFGAVCVNGQWVGAAARRLGGSAVRVAAVVGFPLGANGKRAKLAEARAVLADGAAEIDMVMALGWAKASRWDRVREEIDLVVQIAAGRLVKVILETAALTTAEIERACRESVAAGAGMVKTSTGFHPGGGATVEAVRLMRSVVGDGAGVKASGGIRTPEQARRMLQAGADRIGSSAAAAWGDALDRRLDEYLASDNLG